MGIVQIKLFGRVQVSHDNWITEVKMTRVIQGLLAYLLINRYRTHNRDVLAALYWGEQRQEKARHSVNTALWRLRRLLEPEGIPPGTYLVGKYSEEVGFNRESPYWLDLDIFEKQINKTLASSYQAVEAHEVEKLVKVLQLYEGELMESFYEDWALRERERLRTLYLNCMAFLLQYEKYHGSYERGLDYGRKILELDPLREEIQREMMRLFMASGQSALAVRQYETCCEILKNELGIKPMEETSALYTQIISGVEPNHFAFSKIDQISLQEIHHKLHQAAQTVEQLRNQLYNAIGSINAYNK
jgi:DNA-binding SARP family transcriptional activator